MPERDQEPMANTVARRPSAREAIERRINDLRAEADQLEKLLDCLPARLPTEADRALWNLAVK